MIRAHYTRFILIAISCTHLYTFTDVSVQPDCIRNCPKIHTLLTSQFNCSTNEFITATWRRFYLIQRLNRTMSILHQLHKSMTRAPKTTISIDTILNILNIYSFKHFVLLSTLQRMNETKSLQPLFDLWNDFKTYKLLQDDRFLQELIQQIFLISHSILLNTTHTRGPNADIKCNTLFAPHSLLDLIDKNIDQFLLQKPEYISDTCLPGTTCFQTKIESAQISTLNTPINVDHIMLRFYHIQRLCKLMEKIKRFSKLSHPFTFQSAHYENETMIIDNHVSFTHEQLILCIEKIIQQKTIAPVMALWSEIKRYTFLDNAEFIKEFCILIFIIEKQLLINSIKPTKSLQQNIFNYLSRIYDVIHSLPIEQVIDALDTVADELYPILEEYEFNSNMSWEQWLTQYMWLVPILASKLVYELLLKLNIIAPSKEDEDDPQTLETDNHEESSQVDALTVPTNQSSVDNVHFYLEQKEEHNE